jgi:hypothetical protein
LNAGAEEVERLRYVSVGLNDAGRDDPMKVCERPSCDAATAVKSALRDKAEWGE